MKKTDWVAEVFSAMRDCGEDISIVYGQKNESGELSAEPRWFELQHDAFDGISGLASLLRGQGFRVDRLPELRDDRLTFWRGVQGVLTVLPTVKSRRRQWLRFDPARQVRFLPVKDRVAWHLFTEEQTQRIASIAKEAGVSVNTYLLSHLDAVVSERLTPPSTSRRWMLPMNLRGAVTRHVESAPHMSFLCVDIGNDMQFGKLQAQIDQLKQRAYHWGVWILLHAGRITGAQAMREDIHKREKQEHGWTGIFSNLGVWDVPGSGSWIFCPAISRVYPVGAGCLTMNGCMAVTLQLHDVLTEDFGTSYSLLEAWRRRCLPESESHSREQSFNHTTQELSHG